MWPRCGGDIRVAIKVLNDVPNRVWSITDSDNTITPGSSKLRSVQGADGYFIHGRNVIDDPL